MNKEPRSKVTKAVFAATGLFLAGSILLYGDFSLPGSQTPLGIQLASASTQLGILGQEAPELELDNWIDGNGKPMDPVRLTDYRGKVVYLYFFQDW